LPSLESWFKPRCSGEVKIAFFADKSESDRNNARMNSPRTGLRVASVMFGIFAIGHILRLINHAQVTIGTHTVPMGVSWVALIVAAIFCIWMWRLSNLRGIA
jgi:Flp pilus assembly protein TadB